MNGPDTGTTHRVEELSFKAIGEALSTVLDPEIDMSVVELGLIYGVRIEPVEGGAGRRVTVVASLTSPACPYAPMLLAMMQGAVAKLPGVQNAEVELSFDPLWDPRTFASEEAKDKLGIF